MDLTHRAHAAVVAFIAATFVTFAAPADADAFCGFYVSGAEADLYNDATMVSLMRQGKRTVLAMQNSYEGPPEDFAMVVPVPVVLEKKQVKTLSDDVFNRLDRLTAPRLVEYWERDPCYKPPKRHYYESQDIAGEMSSRSRRSSAKKSKPKVQVHAKFKVGEYDIVILSSTESTALEDWLNQNKYNIPKGAAPYFKPYIQNGQYFFVAKVDVEKVKFQDGKAVLSPLRFHYDSDDFMLPVRLGLINSKGAQDLIAFVLGKNQRYEVANYPNVTIPTNIIVNEEVKKNFGGFYNELFNNVMKENPKAVVTEYSWATSTCDPCPGPPLRPNDILSLGADVIDGQASKPSSSNDPPGQRRRRRFVQPPPRMNTRGWVVTRLHARYNKHTLGKDLVFKKAPPIIGGRGMPQGAEGMMHEKGSRQANVNNFQGRYIKLNHWEGAVDCENPRRGVWGGPNGQGQARSQAAGDIAFDKPESDYALAKYVEEENVPGLKFPTKDYSEPVGNLFPVVDTKSGGMGDGKINDGNGNDGNKAKDGSGGEVRHPRGSGTGGCAGPSGESKAGLSFVVLLLAFGGLGKILWRRE
ncbi:DUF2330 domain-containing protein [Persicimonas caeni]|uniref:DUF2330 domain-containing protein n=1 Tax=Persicimonas caeni TaxID=2292766 RepID=A0A4Y6PUK5_PERCE|nr:DUF2330 domain-containing protein [Persicimonas caeni]QDG52002.1 DUF2330 domain-containing protein [Persicimonas caeni]QED33223.1 DUF2330 domain-containing protein [Persicimonas caeni]